MGPRGTVIAIVIAVVVIGAGPATHEVMGAGGPLRVGMVLPGPINDKGFNQTGYDGLLACRREGAKISYAEDTPVPQFVKTFQNLARQNDVVIGHGFEFGDVADQVAPQFPHVKFVVTSNPLRPKTSNVVHLMINSTQGAFLAGALAGMVTASKKLGGIAGFKFPILAAQMQAFGAGAASVNPAASTRIVYLGTFDDVAKGNEAAQSLAAAGVDIIYHIADAAGIGVIDGAREAHIKVIGWGEDQHSVAPDTVIASQIVDQAEQIGRICTAIKEGAFQGGTVHVDGLRSGLVGLSPLYNVPPSLQQRLGRIEQRIESGAVAVPSIGGGIPGSGPGGG
jgi:basic membrane protein A and related proteins